ncbi:MAG: hypothetical protein M1818_003798 [Claussenomyces sp. TS43310]|nr:MAG: hypothetical protein M1818_003798 [Claussenomyces sp. TS43310]
MIVDPKLPGLTLRGNITYSEAVDLETNVLQSFTYWEKRDEFIGYLLQHRQEIEATVSSYLRLQGAERCRLSSPEDWIHGSFNLCLPVYIDNWRRRSGGQVIIRFPLPFKVGDSNYPGNSEEKLRCEAATYAWIRENCPDVPIPYLWGFAFAGGGECAQGCSFIALENASLVVRFFENFRRRICSLLGRAVPCQYIPLRLPYNLQVGHLVIDYIEENNGKMLSETWEEHRHDKPHRTNLFRDLSRIILSLGRIHLPRIGSFTMDNKGVLALTNRPLTLQLHQLENEGIPTNIARDTTYVTTDAYFLDILACHSNRLVYQPNAVNNEEDCRAQMAVLTAFRAVFPHFVRRDLRRGPFLFTLTDLHQSNIFVDDDWNIKYLIDLEWACSLPMEMQHPPYWLTSQSVDHLWGEGLKLFEEKYEEFLEIFADEEGQSLLRTHTMRKGWEDKNFFYFLALDSITGLYSLFLQHIQPKFADHILDDHFERILSPYWRTESEQFVASKIQEKSAYDARLKAEFKMEADN